MEDNIWHKLSAENDYMTSVRFFLPVNIDSYWAYKQDISQKMVQVLT
jgi:hypothetical protein